VAAKAADMKGATSSFSQTRNVRITFMRIAWSYRTPDADAFNSSPAINIIPGGDTLGVCRRTSKPHNETAVLWSNEYGFPTFPRL
jgi:hypothetical protein